MTVTCHHCKKEYNKLFAACPFCGMKNDQIVTRFNKKPSCPRCHIPLRIARIRDNELDICASCYGIWLDMDEFNYLVSERDVYSDQSIPRKYEKKPLSAKVMEGKKYIPCPRCDLLMNRKNFKKISGVIIDVCMHHGVWLDSGELEQIRSFVANVDYDEHILKKTELNKEEMKSLKRQLDNVKLVQLATNFWNLKYWLYK